MSEATKVVGLVCAAGVGSRMGLGSPKQYMKFGSEAMLVHRVRALRAVERMGEIVVVVSPTDPYIDDVARHFPENVRVLRCGGRERAESVVNGLLNAGFDRDAWVLVHDAARPCLKPSEAARLIDEVLADGGVSGGILAVPVADTIKRADKSRMILETVPRSDLWRAATPQMFRVHDLVEALSGDLAGITDEASAMERLDSHRLVEGRPLILGGVQIPFELGLDGHSDADVLLHAVTDAVLGAAALGDIGQHFPPSDPKWKGADSRVLLRAVVALARQKGWTVVNCDATIVAERPKIGPHMPAIRASLAETLGVSEEVVNVKAKTNERMDAVGRMEGMMAQAVVLMSRMA